MSDINRVILVGRLVKDAELKYVGESAMCRFSIAVNRSRKDQGGNWTEETYYFDLTWWGKGAESASRYLVKGKQVAIDGSLRMDKWTDQNGNQRSKVEIFCENLELLGGRETPEQGEKSSNFTPKNMARVPEPDHFDDDGIPF